MGKINIIIDESIRHVLQRNKDEKIIKSIKNHINNQDYNFSIKVEDLNDFVKSQLPQLINFEIIKKDDYCYFNIMGKN